jgi:hypothetical protein
MNSTIVEMCFVIVLNQLSESSSSCWHYSVFTTDYSTRSEGKRVHDRLFHAFHNDIHRIRLNQRMDEIHYIGMVRRALHKCDFIYCQYASHTVQEKMWCPPTTSIGA